MKLIDELQQTCINEVALHHKMENVKYDKVLFSLFYKLWGNYEELIPQKIETRLFEAAKQGKNMIKISDREYKEAAITLQKQPWQLDDVTICQIRQIVKDIETQYKLQSNNKLVTTGYTMNIEHTGIHNNEVVIGLYKASLQYINYIFKVDHLDNNSNFNVKLNIYLSPDILTHRLKHQGFTVVEGGFTQSVTRLFWGIKFSVDWFKVYE